MIAKEHRTVVLNQRVRDVLALLDRSPLPAHLILQASATFGTPEDPDDGFTDIRRVRERLQQLAEAGFVSIHSYPIIGHGLMNFYHLTPAGYRMVYQVDLPSTDRQFFREIAPTRYEHSFALARVIVHTMVAAYRRGIRTVSFRRENAVPIAVAGRIQKPDALWQLESDGRVFNYLFEVDMGTAPLDSAASSSIRSKIATYEAYYDVAWSSWKRGERSGQRARYRVLFLTPSVERSRHILVLARAMAKNRDRHLCYAVTLESYLAESDALLQPILLDHHGHWQAAINLRPQVPFERQPVQLPVRTMEGTFRF